MDPMYYNQWWNNSGGNNWYMDPHKPALNQPPPAHNMSGPPQHPLPHGMNMPTGQQIPPRAMQPGYMLPRPAHTGSPVNMTPKQTQPSSGLGPKLQHPGGSSSPKPLAPSNALQDKSGMANTPPPSNLPMATAAKAASIPSLIPAADGPKQIHSMPQQQQSYHQLNQMHQQRPVQHMMQHSLQQPQQQAQQQQAQQQQAQQQQAQQQQQQAQQQQQQAQQQQQQAQQQQQQAQQQQQQAQQHQQQVQQQHQQPQLHQQPMPNQQITVPQQQIQINQLPTQQNLQQLPSTAVQQHNQLLQNVAAIPKQDTPKGPTPPLPGLISISSKQPLTTQTLPPSPKPAENKQSSVPQIPNSAVQKPLPPISNSTVAVAPVKPVLSPSSVTTPSSIISNNSSTPTAVALVPLEPAKAVNVSITPAKPVVTAQKPELNKTGHTVTITPSFKPTESVEGKVNEATKITSDSVQNTTIPVGSEPNLNGVSSNKLLTKPIVTPNASKPTDSMPSDKTPASLALKSSPVNPASTQSTATPVKANQHPIPFPKHSPTVQTPKQSSIQPISVKPAAANTSTKPPAPASPKLVAPASPKLVAPASPKLVAPASPKPVAPASPKPVAPASPKPPAPASPKLPASPKPPVTISPLKPSHVAPINQSVNNVNQPSPSKPVTPVVSSSPAKSANIKVYPQPVNPQLSNQPHNATISSSKSTVHSPLQLLSSLQKNPAAITSKQNEIMPVKTQEKSKQESTPLKPVLEKLESQSAKRAKPAPPVTKKPVQTPTPARQPRIRKLVETPLKTAEIDISANKIESSSKSGEVEETPRRAARTKRKVSETPSEGERKSKRSRNPATVYQSPIPDIISRVTRNISATLKSPQEKLVYFFKNEHVALRNAEGTFYLCQIAQNVYKSTKKIKIRWLSPIDEKDKECDGYKPDYYDITDFDCILTSVALQKGVKSVMKLPAEERKRILNILQRAMDRDKGISPEKAELVEDHPDGLDLSLYNDESQLKKRKRKGRKLTEGTTSDESGVESGDEGEDVKKDIDEDYKDEEGKADTNLRQKTSIKKDVSVVKGDGVVEKNVELKSSEKKCYIEDDDDDDEEEDEEDDEESDEEDSEEDEPPKKISRSTTGGRKSIRGASASRGRGAAAAKASTPAPITTSTPRRGGRKAPAPRGSARNNRITPESPPTPISEKKENVKLEVASKQEDIDELPIKSSRNPRGAAKPPLPKETASLSTKMTRRSRK